MHEGLPGSIERFAQLWQGKVPSYSMEKRYVSKDGVPVWIETTVSLNRDAQGKATSTIAIFQDISERKRLEEELRRAKHVAEAGNRAKDEFLINVSHEIRTPMNVILGMTELMLDGPLSDDQRRSLGTVKSAADNLLEIINDLLDFSRIEEGKLELDSVKFSLRTAVSDSLRALAVRAQRKGLQIVCNVQPDVPDLLIGDAGRLRQVLLNLLGNAIKFTEKGEVIVNVSPAVGAVDGCTDDDQAHVHFVVHDTGIGIPKEKQSTIFQAFEQTDTSTTRKYGGTGLGLTIAAQLVASMDGSIAVESEPERGSTFSFTARFGKQAESSTSASTLRVDEQGAKEPVGKLSSLGGSSFRSLRILVAEDSEFNALLMEKLLSRYGHAVTLVDNGRDTVHRASAADFDLLLLDVHMPELDGFGVIRQIREREQAAGGQSHLKVIALTARSRKEDRDRCLAAGMDEFLSKPVQTEELWATIERVAGASTATADRPTAERLVDSRTLLAACGGDNTILRGICDALRARLPDELYAVNDALRNQDALRLREAAHKLAGMVSAFSTSTASVASELEDLAAGAQLEPSTTFVAQLNTMVTQLLQLVGNLTIAKLQLSDDRDPS